ncbi:putative transposase [Pelagimonas varians]|uniref:Transposase n=1 Tax=Pelagimonas varians TaxID=696760 RepID=A0A238L538_9RHOB|nr:putative transposase [Pelagimonas varians]SMX50088.1 Putative transposase [Pelagimonas varians]
MQAGVLSARAGFIPTVSTLGHLERLLALHRAGELNFFGDLAALSEPQAFAAYLAPLRKKEWVVYAKPPFGGPEAGLAYLSRYTHRVAISNSRIVSADANTVAFRWKDYRIKNGERLKVIRLATPEFIRRFLIHVLPDGFHRIRHYGLLASGNRKANIAKARALLGAEPVKNEDPPTAEIIPLTLREPCPDCGGQMRIIETFRRGQKPQTRAPPRKVAA